MKKLYSMIPLFLGLSFAAFLPQHHQYRQETIGQASSYASRLEKYRQAAIDSLVQVNLDDYRAAQAEEITTLRQQTIAQINQCEDYNEIDSIVSSHNRYLLTIKTDAQMTEEEAGEIPQGGTYYISSLNDLIDFRDDVNSGYNYAGETVVLTNDIIIPNGYNFGDSIGHTNDAAFRGTFDGGNHKISGFTKTGADSVGLFSRVTDGTIKNLVIENVNVTCEGQRGAGLVSRIENATLQNISITGTSSVKGTKESGGIAGVSLGNNTIINCSNAASVTGTSTYGIGGIVGHVYNGTIAFSDCENTGTVSSAGEYVGGILGYTTSSSTSITITDCVNRGNITSNAGNGCGGILGATADNIVNLTLTIDGCVNYGTITGAAHVGGVAGLPRASGYYTGGTSSTIIRCENRGNVTSTLSSCVGGIVSRARINVINCGCLPSVTLTSASTSKTASECNEIGNSTTPGYICALIDTSGNYRGSVSGSYLID